MWARTCICVHAYKLISVQLMHACIHVLCNHGKPLDACINELIEYTMWLFAWKGTTNAYLVAAVGIIYMYVLTAPTSAEVHVEVLSIRVY